MLPGRLTSSRFRLANVLMGLGIVVGTLWMSGCRPSQRPAAPRAPATRAAETSDDDTRDDVSTAVPGSSTAERASSPTVEHVPQSNPPVDAGDVTVDADDATQPIEPSATADSREVGVDNSAAGSDPPASTHRLLVLLPGGPLLLDLQLLIDGRPHEQLIAELTDDVLSAGDVDGDGIVTWNELTTSDAFKFGQWGNARAEDETQRKSIVYRCDVNRNHRVDADELSRFLSPADTASSWIRVASSPAEERPLDASPLFAWLDQDRNHQLDEREIKQATMRLRLLDREDDGVLGMDELPGMTAATEMALRSPTAASRSRGEPARVAILQQASDWSRVLYAIEDRYAFGSPVQAVDLPSREALFKAVDANHDGYWSVGEAPSLLEQPADLTLLVHYSSGGSTLEVGGGGGAERSANAHQQANDQLTLPWDQGELVIRSAETQSARDPTWEALWPQWDANGDGALDADEYARAEPLLNMPLIAIDQNQDGLVQLSEGLDAVRRRARAGALRIEIELSTDGEPMLRRLDTDADSQLSERELDAVARRLRDLAGPDRVLTASDLTPTQVLQFRRGDGNGATGEPARVAVTARAQASPERANSLPPWFVESDRNRDGEISRREFLGPRALLEQLDRNGDGRLQPDEVAPGASGAAEPAQAPKPSSSASPGERASPDGANDRDEPPKADSPGGTPLAPNA